MEQRLIIKEESITLFFEGVRQDKLERSMDRINLYYYFKDDIIIEKNKIEYGIKEIEFVLTDYGKGSNKKLINTYVYQVEEHDSISYKLALIDFKVELV